MNIVSIRQKVERAISKAPLQITLLRPNKISDGMGGFIIPEIKPVIELGKLQGILDNSRDSNQIPTIVTPAGTITRFDGPIFITIWKEGLDIKKGDFFILDGTTYTVLNPVNILNMNIYWQLALDTLVKDSDINEY